MPVQTSSPITAAFPSFMSVYGGGNTAHNELDDAERVRVFPGPLGHQSKQSLSTTHPLPLSYHHRESLTSLSDSADSSPTTTNSTFDSVSMTDPSPSSSPESPTSLLPLSPLKPAIIEKAHPMLEKNVVAESQRSLSTLASPYSHMSDSPSAKGRNVKNLSLNMSPPATRPSTSAGVPTSFALSAPTSPLRNVRSARRKPANLTIQTPGFDKLTFSQAGSDPIPPTPSQRPSLRHFESSPSLFAPKTAPPPGLQHHQNSLSSLHSRTGSQSSVSFHNGIGSALDNLQEEEAPPKSQEAQERGYTEGPARIYDSGLYLYLEPTKEEASKFDVVINVAKEVANPFTSVAEETRDTIMSVWRNGSSDIDRQRTPEPETAASERSFKSAFEWPVSNSPTTPKPGTPEPEYIHVPWDHNSEILEDLFPLCQVIDERIKQGKSVLVHCQLGVSRSASLVIAYGLYKNFQSDFHGMYLTVKERSRWVGPNMSLIYQLNDFRSKCGSGSMNHKAAPAEWFKNPGVDKKNDTTATPKASLLEATASQPAVPPPPYPRMVSSSTQTDPLRITTETRPRFLPPVPLFSEAVQTTPSIESPLSGPLAPPKRDTPSPPGNAKRHAARPLPLREKQYSPARNMQSLRIPPRASEISSASGKPTARPLQMDLMMQDVPASPSVFSPRATQFMATAFHPRTSAAAGDLQSSTARHSMDLDMPGAFPQSRPVSVIDTDVSMTAWTMDPVVAPVSKAPADPRSPHQTAEGEIVRSIDDVF